MRKGSQFDGPDPALTWDKLYVEEQIYPGALDALHRVFLGNPFVPAVNTE